MCCHVLLFVFVFFFFVFFFVFFSVRLSIVITSLGEERAGLCASRAFVCLFSMLKFLPYFSFSWCQRLIAACNCGTPWAFLLFFLFFTLGRERERERERCSIYISYICLSYTTYAFLFVFIPSAYQVWGYTVFPVCPSVRKIFVSAPYLGKALKNFDQILDIH